MSAFALFSLKSPSLLVVCGERFVGNRQVIVRATTSRSGVGLTHPMYAPGSYSMNISTERKVTSFRHVDARVRPVSVNHCQESAVGNTQGASGFSATTGIIAGPPGEAAATVLVTLGLHRGDKSAG